MSLNLFEDLTQEEMSGLLSQFEKMSFEEGDVILTQETVDRSVYILTSGTACAVLAPTEQVPERMVEELGPGAVLGEMAFFDGLPRSASIIALSDGEMLCLSWATFERWCQTDPVLALKLVLDMARVVSVRLRRTLSHLQSGQIVS